MVRAILNIWPLNASKNGRKRRRIYKVVGMISCNVLVSLCKNIEMREANALIADPLWSFSALWRKWVAWNSESDISRWVHGVSTLKRFNIVVESPATLFDVIDEMEDLRSGSPTVSELVAFLPRAWAVLQPIWQWP